MSGLHNRLRHEKLKENMNICTNETSLTSIMKSLSLLKIQVRNLSYQQRVGKYEESVYKIQPELISEVDNLKHKDNNFNEVPHNLNMFKSRILPKNRQQKSSLTVAFGLPDHK